MRGERTPDGTLVSDYDYELPADRIAQYPAERRDESRLLVVPSAGPISHRRFPDLVDLIAEGDLLVVNESRVFPARLLGRKPTGAEAEVLLVRQPDEVHEPLVWEALVRPGRKLKPGRRVVLGDDCEVEIVDSLPSGNRLVRFATGQ